MAINIVYNGANLLLPGAYSKTTTTLLGGNSQAPAGIVGIIGESDAGMPGSADDIRQNFFAPEQFADVVAKYKSGPIVDAFKILIQPSNDARITNGAQKVYIYKTNLATKALGSLATAFGTLYSANYGFSENTINFKVEDSQSEVTPALPPLAWIIPTGTTAGAIAFRVNGGAKLPLVIAAAELPNTVQAAIEGLTGLHATGGVNRGIVSAVGTPTIGITFSGDLLSATLTYSKAAWESAPVVGDSLYIPTGSVIAGTAANVGGYLITAVTANTLTALKSSLPKVNGATVAPQTVVAVTDVMAFSPIIVSVDATTLAGQGASLEVFDNGGTQPFGDMIYGGTDLGLLTNTQVIDGSTLALSIVSGAAVTITISTAFAAQAQIGDIINIRPGSILVGAANANAGNYLVTAATSSVISATKFSGSPAGVSAVDIVSADDLNGFAGIFSTSSIPLIHTSSAEREVTINVNRQSDGVAEDSLPLGGDVVMSVGFDGATAVMTIDSVHLTTTTTTPANNLSLKLSDYDTIQQLVDYINAQSGYTAEVSNNVYASLSPSDYLDQVVAIGICAENDGALPGRVKADSKNIQNFFDASSLVTLTRTAVTGFTGLPAAMSSVTFLSGGLKGGTNPASVQAGFDSMLKVRVNTVVPLFSRDATSDIIEGLTEASSSYTIDAINAALRTHVLLMSDTKHRSERNGYASYKGTYIASKARANVLSSYKISFAIQDVKIQKIDGTLEFVQPWGLACIAAGMQAGANVGEPMTKKYANISGVTHTDFDPATQYDDAISNGILFVSQQDSGGFNFAVGNTTYGADSSFVYNRISVVYAADICAYNLRKELEAAFVGTGGVQAVSVKNKAMAILSGFLSSGWTVPDSTNGGSGYKNLTVTIVGNVITLGVTLTIVQGADFILNNIVLDTTNQSA